MLETGKMSKQKDVSEFDGDRTVTARQLGRSISKTAKIWNGQQRPNKEVKLMNQLQSRGWHFKLKYYSVIGRPRWGAASSVRLHIYAGVSVT